LGPQEEGINPYWQCFATDEDYELCCNGPGSWQEYNGEFVDSCWNSIWTPGGFAPSSFSDVTGVRFLNWDSKFVEKECCKQRFLQIFPVPLRQPLKLIHPAFEAEHVTWEVVHFQYFANRTISLPPQAEDLSPIELIFYDWHESPQLDTFINEFMWDEMYELADLQLPRNSLILDVGANIGLFALSVAARHPTCFVFAMEPNPGIFRELVTNIHRNGLSHQIFPINAAACERGDKQITVDVLWWASNMREFDINHKGPFSLPVPCMTFPDVLAYMALVWSDWQGDTPMPGHISLAKVDCEGCEYSFLSKERASNPNLWQLAIDRVSAWTGEVHDKIIIPGLGWASLPFAAHKGHILQEDMEMVMHLMCGPGATTDGCPTEDL